MEEVIAWSVVTRYGIDGSLEPRWEQEIFLLSIQVQNGRGAHPDPPTMGTLSSSPVEKLLRRSVDYYPHLVTRLKMSRTICTSEVLTVPAWYVTGRPLPFHDRVDEVNIALKWTSL
jgi:hypothetical protein